MGWDGIGKVGKVVENGGDGVAKRMDGWMDRQDVGREGSGQGMANGGLKPGERGKGKGKG